MILVHDSCIVDYFAFLEAEHFYLAIYCFFFCPEINRMAASLALRQAVGTIQNSGPSCSSGCRNDFSGSSVKLFPKECKLSLAYSTTRSFSSVRNYSGVVQASASQVSDVDAISSPFDSGTSSSSKKKSRKSTHFLRSYLVCPGKKLLAY